MERIDRSYFVNVRRLAVMLLPTWLRGAVAVGLVYGGVAPLGRLLGTVRRLREDAWYRLEHNGQVCKLRGLLNDEFDARGRRIRIVDGASEGEGAAEGTVWQRAVGRWKILGSEVLRVRGFGGVNGFDFYVEIGEELRGRVDELRLRAIVNMYKPAGKRYAIIYK